MGSTKTIAEARLKAYGPLNGTGCEQAVLLQYIQELEEKCMRLEEENRRFKAAAARRASAAPSMNSRLKDALRE